MLTAVLAGIFERDINKLKNEILQYKTEENLWIVENNIANSAGNLCLHLIGNLNTYIGKELGNTGYVRDRPLEFSAKHVPRHELIDKIDDVAAIVAETMQHVSEDTLAKEYPVVVFQEPSSTEFMLIHLATHLSYHLGQINYHRRLLDA
ncbi:MAG: DinB superfamily protein [Chitinophaga sp.]|jgi:uncharacterized damage-inducible protein DinB|nr:DinB superfamily protein [Chitinophaga sp.]